MVLEVIIMFFMTKEANMDSLNHRFLLLNHQPIHYTDSDSFNVFSGRGGVLTSGLKGLGFESCTAHYFL